MPEISLSDMKTEKPSVLNILARSDFFESKGQINRSISQEDKTRFRKVEDAESMVTNRHDYQSGKKIFVRVVN